MCSHKTTCKQYAHAYAYDGIDCDIMVMVTITCVNNCWFEGLAFCCVIFQILKDSFIMIFSGFAYFRAGCS